LGSGYLRGFMALRETMFFFEPNRPENSNPSRTAIPDGNLTIRDNHRDLALSAGQLEHFVKTLFIPLHVKVIVLFIGRPGLLGVGSSRLSINKDLCRHHFPLSFRKVLSLWMKIQ